MNDRSTSESSKTFIATSPASVEAKRCALAIAITLFVAFCALVPFAGIRLPRIEAFIPLNETTLVLSCLVTAGFLVVSFRRSRLRAVLVLATGYLFTSLLSVSYILTSPGALSSSGLLGAGPQTSPWLDVFRHAGFPLFAISYALVKRRERPDAPARPEIRGQVLSAAAGAIAVVCLLTLLATAGHQLLPPIINGDAFTNAAAAASIAVLLLGIPALTALGSGSRYSVLDLWLMVAVGVWMLDWALDTVINRGRFDVGFYAGHLYGLCAASVLPIVLLVEASRLYSRLDEAGVLAERRNEELARSREELAQSQRLEAIGQLTGGVAHDFNNLLTVIIGNLDLILDAHGDPEKVQRLAQSAMKAAERGEHLVRQLLTYARRQISHPQTVNLNQLIANLEQLMHRVIGEQIEVTTMLSPDLALVEIDPAQFEAALLNLAINSRDAMPGGGRIKIETRNVVLNRQDLAEPEMTPGPYVMIAVSDTGMGMTPAVLAKAFDPFFTTKEVGKGSGLGLSQVYGFVKAAGGCVNIDSEPGTGTTVSLCLPKSSDRRAAPEPVAESVSLPPAGASGTILVVEDDEDVLAVTAESLKELGYHVVAAVDAAQAVEILQSDQPIDLLFSDVVIPGGTNGAQLAVKARRLRPELKVLLTSGYTAAALSLEHGLPDDLNLVAKPYQREELAKQLRQAIGG